MAMGERCLTPGERYLAMGELCLASGERCLTLGERCLATGERCLATGERCLATGERERWQKPSLASPVDCFLDLCFTDGRHLTLFSRESASVA